MLLRSTPIIPHFFLAILYCLLSASFVRSATSISSSGDSSIAIRTGPSSIDVEFSTDIDYLTPPPSHTSAESSQFSMVIFTTTTTATVSTTVVIITTASASASTLIASGTLLPVPPSHNDSERFESPGALAGLIVGVSLALFMIFIYAFFTWRRHRKRQLDDSDISEKASGPTPVVLASRSTRRSVLDHDSKTHTRTSPGHTVASRTDHDSPGRDGSWTIYREDEYLDGYSPHSPFVSDDGGGHLEVDPSSSHGLSSRSPSSQGHGVVQNALPAVLCAQTNSEENSGSNPGPSSIPSSQPYGSSYPLLHEPLPVLLNPPSSLLRPPSATVSTSFATPPPPPDLNSYFPAQSLQNRLMIQDPSPSVSEVSLAWGREDLLERPRMQTTTDSIPSLQDEIDYSRRIVGIVDNNRDSSSTAEREQ